MCGKIPEQQVEAVRTKDTSSIKVEASSHDKEAPQQPAQKRTPGAIPGRKQQNVSSQRVKRACKVLNAGSRLKAPSTGTENVENTAADQAPVVTVTTPRRVVNLRMMSDEGIPKMRKADVIAGESSKNGSQSTCPVHEKSVYHPAVDGDCDKLHCHNCHSASLQRAETVSYSPKTKCILHGPLFVSSNNQKFCLGCIGLSKGRALLDRIEKRELCCPKHGYKPVTNPYRSGTPLTCKQCEEPVELVPSEGGTEVLRRGLHGSFSTLLCPTHGKLHRLAIAQNQALFCRHCGKQLLLPQQLRCPRHGIIAENRIGSRMKGLLYCKIKVDKKRCEKRLLLQIPKDYPMHTNNTMSADHGFYVCSAHGPNGGVVYRHKEIEVSFCRHCGQKMSLDSTLKQTVTNRAGEALKRIKLRLSCPVHGLRKLNEDIAYRIHTHELICTHNDDENGRCMLRVNFLKVYRGRLRAKHCENCSEYQKIQVKGFNIVYCSECGKQNQVRMLKDLSSYQHKRNNLSDVSSSPDEAKIETIPRYDEAVHNGSATSSTKTEADKLPKHADPVKPAWPQTDAEGDDKKQLSEKRSSYILMCPNHGYVDEASNVLKCSTKRGVNRTIWYCKRTIESNLGEVAEILNRREMPVRNPPTLAETKPVTVSSRIMPYCGKLLSFLPRQVDGPLVCPRHADHVPVVDKQENNLVCGLKIGEELKLCSEPLQVQLPAGLQPLDTSKLSGVGAYCQSHGFNIGISIVGQDGVFCDICGKQLMQQKKTTDKRPLSLIICTKKHLVTRSIVSPTEWLCANETEEGRSCKNLVRLRESYLEGSTKSSTKVMCSNHGIVAGISMGGFDLPFCSECGQQESCSARTYCPDHEIVKEQIGGRRTDDQCATCPIKLWKPVLQWLKGDLLLSTGYCSVHKLTNSLTRTAKTKISFCLSCGLLCKDAAMTSPYIQCPRHGELKPEEILLSDLEKHMQCAKTVDGTSRCLKKVTLANFETGVGTVRTKGERKCKDHLQAAVVRLSGYQCDFCNMCGHQIISSAKASAVLANTKAPSALRETTVRASSTNDAPTKSCQNEKDDPHPAPKRLTLTDKIEAPSTQHSAKLPKLAKAEQGEEAMKSTRFVIPKKRCATSITAETPVSFSETQSKHAETDPYCKRPRRGLLRGTSRIKTVLQRHVSCVREHKKPRSQGKDGKEGPEREQLRRSRRNNCGGASRNATHCTNAELPSSSECPKMPTGISSHSAKTDQTTQSSEKKSGFVPSQLDMKLSHLLYTNSLRQLPAQSSNRDVSTE